MRSQFLTMVQLEQGSVCMLVAADSRDQLLARWPKLQVLDARPPWLTDEQYAEVQRRAIDVDDDDPFLAHLHRD